MSSDERRTRGVSRRGFLGSAAAAAAFSVVPSTVLAGGGTSPSDKLNIAGVGVGGMGKNNIDSCANDANIVALCDVDENHARGAFEDYPDAEKYNDYRRMLDEMGDSIDGVVIATPDHSHAVITAAAMKRGIHVYTQKPLTNTVRDARRLRELDKQTDVVTAMGNQGHSGNGTRTVVEWIRAGIVGDVREVHCWTNRPTGWWPQGEVEINEADVPDHLDWDLWLGPAQERPYSPAYLPFKWRGFWDFGCGALGDMGCHIMDPPYWALKLGAPKAVEASSTPVYEETAPKASVVHYEFPARDGMPPVDLYWYDGKIRPPRPVQMKAGGSLRPNGSLFVGEKGALMCSTYGGDPRPIPATLLQDFDRPDPYIPRVPGGQGGHEQKWLDAIKEGEKASSSFDYACPLTETVVLGNLAIRARKRIKWDSDNLKVTNVDEANKYVGFEYRDGWSL